MYRFFCRSAAAIVLAVVTELEETVVKSTILLFGIDFCRHSYLAIFYDQKPARPHSRLPRPMSCPRGKKGPTPTRAWWGPRRRWDRRAELAWGLFSPGTTQDVMFFFVCVSPGGNSATPILDMIPLGNQIF